MKRTIIIIALLSLAIGAKSQEKEKKTSTDSLMNSLSSDDANNKKALPAFKGTRLILAPSTETAKANTMNFMVVHRFGDLGTSTGGARTAYGLDAVNDVYIGFEYGATDNLNINVGRSTVGQLIEFQLKYALVHQASDGSPVNITALAGAGVHPYGNFTSFGNRWSYIAEAMFSRRITSAFSLQVAPIFVQDNTPLPNIAGVEQSFFALSAAGRLKVTKIMSFVVDYSHSFSSFRTGANGFSDPFGVGAEFQTGGHVFMINITNARATSQINSLSDSRADYGRGEYRVGFTISRSFDFSHKTKKDW